MSGASWLNTVHLPPGTEFDNSQVPTARARLAAPEAGALPIAQGSGLSSSLVRKKSPAFSEGLGSDRTWDQAVAVVGIRVQVARAAGRSTTYENPEVFGH